MQEWTMDQQLKLYTTARGDIVANNKDLFLFSPVVTAFSIFGHLKHRFSAIDFTAHFYLLLHTFFTLLSQNSFLFCEERS